MSTDSKIIEEALDFAATSCRYHGADFGFLGWEPWGPPRCDSCKEPWAVRRARGSLAALVAELDRRPIGDLIAASSLGAALAEAESQDPDAVMSDGERGYQQAIHRLRDAKAIRAWERDTRPAGMAPLWSPLASHALAAVAYLEARRGDEEHRP